MTHPNATGPVVRPPVDRAWQFRELQRNRLERYLQLQHDEGDEVARETSLDGYPEKQRDKMGPLITGRPLIHGFQQAVPMFATIGVAEEVIDVSDGETDAVLEIATTCMCATACRDLGLSTAVPVLCELDFEATRRAFPNMTVKAVRRQVDGAHVCIFRYARPHDQEDTND